MGVTWDKRQKWELQCRIASELIQRVKDCSYVFGVREVLIKRIKTVSYTHLDVYKRQGREYSTNQGCMQKIIWFCLNLRQLSFAIEKKSTDLSLIHI